MGSWFSRPFVADSSKGHSAQPVEYSQCDVTGTEVHQQNDGQLLVMNPNHCQHIVIVMDLNLKGCLHVTIKIVQLNGFTLNVSN